jgi:gluconate 2-dehydrogenase alpha chain
MAQEAKTDVVLIGMGAVGGIAAYVLTKAGLNVVGIEAGPRLGNADFVKQFDEVGGSSFLRNELGGPKFNREIPTWRPNAQSPTSPPPGGVGGMANLVGGTTVHYGAQSWRFRVDDFKIRSATIEKQGKSALPAGAVVRDWPITYQELEPYYDNVEYLIGVSGKAGANPFEGPRSRDFPMPALRPLPFASKVGEAMKHLGYHPFPQPTAITSKTYDGRPACSYCGFCGDGFGCWNSSKGSTLVTAIPEAEKTGKLKILTNSRVMKIEHDEKGRVTGVTYRDKSGRTHHQPARFVIVGTFVYENTRLLLLSKGGKYPHGLANNNGQVGKYYRTQTDTSVSGLFPEQLNVWGGTAGQTTVMDDLNGDVFDHRGLGFIRGADIQVSANNMPIAGSANLPPGVPLWGSQYKQFMHESAGAVGGLLAQMETLNYPGNFIDLDPTKKDDLGVPVARVTYSVGQNEQKMSAYLTTKMQAILKAAGATKTWGGIVIPQLGAHTYGGTIMGDDPKSSVVDRFGITHEARNLAVMGGSTFVSTSGYNPTETIEALAWYGAEHIAKNFDSLTA